VIASSLVFGDCFIHSYDLGVSGNQSFGFLVLRTYFMHGNASYQRVYAKYPNIVRETQDYLGVSCIIFLRISNTHIETLLEGRKVSFFRPLPKVRIRTRMIRNGCSFPFEYHFVISIVVRYDDAFRRRLKYVNAHSMPSVVPQSWHSKIRTN